MYSRYFWALMFILAGLLFLLDNFGLLPGNAWGYIWAVFLMLIGVNLLFGRRYRMRSEAVQDSLPLNGAKSSHIIFKHGAGRLHVGAGADSDLLYDGTFGGGIDKPVRRSGETLDLVLQMATQDWTLGMWPWNWWRGPGSLDWDVDLNPNIPLALEFETGASQTELDLSALRVVDLVVKTGASSTALTMPAQTEHTRAKISSGAASVNIHVPAGVAARIRGTMGLGAINVDQARFPRHNGSYESDDFATAAHRVELEIEGGVGAVTVH
jgi:cell wall-active antibiotic response 4TMS protein YvqF